MGGKKEKLSVIDQALTLLHRLWLGLVAAVVSQFTIYEQTLSICIFSLSVSLLVNFSPVRS